MSPMRRHGGRDGSGRDDEREPETPILRDAVPAGVSPLVWPASNSGREALAESQRAQVMRASREGAAPAARTSGDGGTAPAEALAAANQSSASAVPASVAEPFTRATGSKVDDVKVHTGPEAAVAADAFGARALAHGTHTHFADGQYDPGSPAGRHLIFHELTHVAQQRSGSPTTQPKLDVSQPGDSHEVEADRVAGSLVEAEAGGTSPPSAPLAVSAAANVGVVARQPSAAPALTPKTPESVLAGPQMIVIAYSANGLICGSWSGPAANLPRGLPERFSLVGGNGIWISPPDIGAVKIMIPSSDRAGAGGTEVTAWAESLKARRVQIRIRGASSGKGGLGEKGDGLAEEGAGTTTITGDQPATGETGGKIPATAADLAEMEEQFRRDIRGSGTGTDSGGTGEGGVSIGRGAGDQSGAGEDRGSSTGDSSGSSTPSWTGDGQRGVQSTSRFGKDGRESGLPGGQPGAESQGVPGALAAWGGVIELPQSIAALIALGAIISDANLGISLGAKGWIKAVRGKFKGQGADKVTKAMEKEAAAVAAAQMADVRQKVVDVPAFNSLDPRAKSGKLGQFEHHLGRHHLRKLRGEINEELDGLKSLRAKAKADAAAASGDTRAGIEQELSRLEEDIRAANKAKAALKDIDPQGDGSFADLDGPGPTKTMPEGFQEGVDLQNKFVSSHWKTHRNFEGMKVYTRTDLIDPSRADPAGLTNLKRMKNGDAPIGPDADSIELHHLNQSNDGPVVEITASMHSDNHSIIHINAGTNLPSGIDRRAFDAWKRHYWISRAKDFE